MSYKRREIVFLVGNGADMLDLAGPMDVFTHTNLLADTSLYSLKIVSTAARITMMGGLTIVPDSDLEAFCPSAEMDTTVIVIGLPPNKGSHENTTLAAWLLRHSFSRIASVCVGAFVLARAGFLDHRRATTHWAFLERLQARYPRIDVAEDAIYIRDENVWTSAGVSAGIDLALALVEHDLGHKVALAVAQHLVLFLRRPGGQSQFSAALQLSGAQQPELKELVEWIPGHLAEDLSVPALAARVHMSRRNFTRRFARELGEPPGTWVEKVRLNAARHCLEATEMSLEEVARHCGFERAANLRRVFLRRLGVSGSEYRQRFAARKLRESKLH